MIRAFAARTASMRVGGFLSSGAGFCLPAIGISGSNCVGAVEPCGAGCTLMGPVKVGLRGGILYNSFSSGWFRCLMLENRFAVVFL
jgi:hypothetical protein